ncbi:MAG: hypothetical protein ACK5P5_07860 [Pseudobdellovibrionaceae bacterium]
MQIIFFLFIGISIQMAQAAEPKLMCYFPNHTEEMSLENCVDKMKNGRLRAGILMKRVSLVL